MANEIPQYFRREQLETPGLPRAPAGQLADVGARLAPDAMARFGGALQGIAVDRLNRMIDAITQSQYTEGKANEEEAETKFLKELELDQDFEGYDKKYKAHIKDLSKQILTKNLTSDAKEALTGYIESQKAALGKKVAAAYLRKQKDYARASMYEAVRKFEMAGNVPAAKAALIEGRDAGSLGAEETAQRMAIVENNVQSHWIQGLINTDPEAAMEAIDILSVDEGEKNRLKSQARTAIARKQAKTKTQYDAYVEAVEQDWLMKLRSNQLTEPEVLASKVTVDKKQEWLADIDKQTDKILKDKEIVTNESVKGELESMAYDIFTGVVTMPEFHKRLKDEWNTTIDDATYDELFSLAERKFESYQATAMNERETFALRQLVDLPSEYDLNERIKLMTSQVDIDQTLALRKLQFDNHDKYKKALRDWQKKNPDATGDEIYTEGRKLLKHFRKSPDQLREESQTVYPKINPDILAVAKKVVKGEYGLRPDGTKKGKGFLGVLKLKGGGVATEYSVGVKLEANEGKETDIPSLVPTLTKAEISLMVNDIIPNKKSVPKKILQKAVDHANKRVKQGKSPFFDSETTQTISDVPVPKDKREFINKLRELEGIDPNLSAEYYNKYLDKFW